MIIQLGLFRLRAATQTEQFLAAVEETTALLKKQEGFIRRVVSKTEQDEWADMVYWTTMDAASHAGEVFGSAPEARQFMGLLAPEQMQLFSLQTMVEQQ